jgi:hypothetical protein
MNLVAVITDGGIISSVDLYEGDELDLAIEDMEVYFGGNSFDGETDDARIFLVPAKGETGVEVYSFDPANIGEARALAVERFKQLVKA